MKKSEHQIQTELISATRLLWDGVCKNSPAYYPELELLYAIPNGGYRSAREAKALVEEGVKSGICDLCLPVARNGFFGLYMELKTDIGVRSDSQKRMMMLLRRQGYDVRVFRDSETALHYILEYLDRPPT